MLFILHARLVGPTTFLAGVGSVRLFIAVNFPPDLRRRLWEAAEPLRAVGYPVRWVAPDGIHVTLKFLGEVKPAREAEILTAMGAAVQGARPFELPIGGFGAFPAVSRPRVLWAGCEPVPSLELLQHRMEQEMERLGFPVEGRAFHPHVTLGRVQRDARPGAFRDLEERLGALEFSGETMVGSVDLMESRLAREGAQYTRRQAVPLAG
jgi:2'-5' RNA ligase